MSPTKKTTKKIPAPIRKAAPKTDISSNGAAALFNAGPQAVPPRPEPVGRSQQEGRYVYGVIESRSPVTFGKSSIGGVQEDVYTTHHGDMAAVVSRTPVFIFDPTRDNALAHEHVIESVMKNYTIIPMSFGTVFRTDDDIREVLKSIYNSLKDVLKQMTGKLEFGLKVTWDRDHIIEELKLEHEEIHRFHLESLYSNSLSF